MFETQTESAIRQRLLDSSNSQLNKNEGGFLWDALSPASIELAQAYIELDRVLKLGFAQTTYGTYLDMRAAEHGITRTSGETDSSLLERLLYKVRLPIASGNANSYIYWAREISGVGDAAVIPLWNGNGTVKVVLIGADKLPVSSTIVTNVTNYIETQRPIGASVTVVSATTKTVSISADVNISSGYTLAQVSSTFSFKLTAHFQAIALKQTFLSYAKVGSLLLETEGVTDYVSLTLNAGTSNITLLNTEVPTIGTVTLI